MFQRRHYEWLARFAGEHLTQEQYHKLASALYCESENGNFDTSRFLRACDRCRELAHAPSESVFKT